MSASHLRTLQDVVDGLQAWGDRRAIGVHGGTAIRWWRYGRLHSDVLRLAAALRDRGVGRGDRVGIWAPNTPEWAAAFFAIALRGGIAVLIDSEVSAADAVQNATAEKCRLLFTEHDATATGGLECVTIGASMAGQALPAEGDVRVAVSPEDPVALLFSSGTTATPKGVLLSHANIVCQVERFRGWRFPLRFLPLRMLVLPPASHVLGLVVGLIVPLSIGLSIVYTTAPGAAAWARLIRDFRIAIALVVPRALQVLEQHVSRSRLGDSGRTLEARLEGAGWLGRVCWPIWARGEVLGRPWFRLILVGGAHLPVSTAQFWRRTAVFVIQGYGLAESTAIVSVSHPFAWRAGDVGRPSHAGLGAVELAPDGEILVRGPHVAIGAGHSGDGNATSRETVLATGDLGRLDHRGRLTIIGSKKEAIVTAEGYSIQPDAVEAELLRQSGVCEAAVLALGTDAGEEIHAVVRVAPGVDASTVVHDANRHLPESHRIRSWTRWPSGEELPRNRMGKVRRREVVTRLAELRSRHGATADPETITLANLVGEADRHRRLQLTAAYLAQAPASRPAGDLRLVEDLGLSSLDIVDLLAQVERIGGVTIPSGALVPSTATLESVRAQLTAEDHARPAVADEGPAGPVWWSAPLRLLQPLVRPAAVAAWHTCSASVRATWEIDPAQIPHPAVLAIAPHRHWLDAFVVARALPRRLGARLHLLVEHDVSEHFRPAPGTPWRSRAWIGFAYYVGLPLLFPFTVLRSHGHTRAGLQDAARRLDRGRVLVSFPKGLASWHDYDPAHHARGVTRLAAEAGCPVVPIWVEADGPIAWRWRTPRQRIHVSIARPVMPIPGESPDSVIAAVEAAFARLATKPRA